MENHDERPVYIMIGFRLAHEPAPILFEYAGTRASRGRCSAAECDAKAIVFVDIPHARFGTYTRGFCADHLARYRRRRGKA